MFDKNWESIVEIDEVELDEGHPIPDILPVVALRNTVLFPESIMPITIGRRKSKLAIEQAERRDHWVAVITQKGQDIEQPRKEDMHTVGIVARVLKVLKLPDGSQAAVLQGIRRFALRELTQEEPYLKGKVHLLPERTPAKDAKGHALLIRAIKEKARELMEVSPNIPPPAIQFMDNLQSDSQLLNFIATELISDLKSKQELLEIDDDPAHAQRIIAILEQELQLAKIKHQIERKTQGDIEKQQRNYFLMQQMKQIQQELGQNPQDEELKKLIKKSKEKKWSKEVAKHFEKELNKVKRMNPQVAEYSIMLNYLELLTDLPWGEYSKDHFDLQRVRKVLDKDHFGLEKVKDRIIEHLAVLKLKGNMKSPILCLVGPPGVGKTSLGRSIAQALKRKFIRMSLGGLHDESEIRGHRKTYIGAMPGRVIQSIKKAGSSNPVFILDEIDKMGKDFRGDPSSALLEVLDPEQNSTFHDNYLEVEYDLSKVLFIATANSLNSIQPALLDRMEIIELSGYSTEEKVEIAKRHLIPKQIKAHGLKSSQVRLGKKAIRVIIDQYTKESGVRSLDRRIAAVMRNIAKKVALSEEYKIAPSVEDVKEILGPERFTDNKYDRLKVPGVAVGLAWTSVGGDILFIEASKNKGKGKLTLTGNLGDVMKESAITALSFIKAHINTLGIDENAIKDMDLHIHVPEGAIPKDGPSAGITMLTAITSLLKNQPVKPWLAMSGEITLRGKVLPVGGIKTKILAAKRAGLKEIMLCRENKRFVEEIEPEYIKGLRFIYVDRMEEVIEHALGK